MDKYEYKLKTEQMLELMESGAYNKAAEIADTIDWKRVRNATMLTNVSDIYERNGDNQKSYEVLNIAYHRAEGSRKVIYRLCALALKTGNVDEAIDYYDDFMQVAPKDPNQHILRYKILRARRAPVEQQIEALEEFKKAEYIEEWAYELARLYQEAGMTAECLEECDDLILWFSEGKFVYKAMELKMQYKQLTPSQQEKYDHRYEKIESETEELPDLTEYQARKAALTSDELDGDEADDTDAPAEVDEGVYEPADDDEVPAEEDSTEREPNHEEMPETEEEPDDLPVDETVQRLEQKGIGSRMKLEDALQSLLRPKKEEPEPEEEELEEDVPELEAAIEEIESVIDLELVNEYAVKRKREIHFDKDLEELKAEPLEEELSDDIEEDPSQEETAAIEAADEELQEAAEEIISEVFSEEAQGAAEAGLLEETAETEGIDGDLLEEVLESAEAELWDEEPLEEDVDSAEEPWDEEALEDTEEEPLEEELLEDSEEELIEEEPVVEQAAELSEDSYEELAEEEPVEEHAVEELQEEPVEALPEEVPAYDLAEEITGNELLEDSGEELLEEESTYGLEEEFTEDELLEDFTGDLPEEESAYGLEEEFNEDEIGEDSTNDLPVEEHPYSIEEEFSEEDILEDAEEGFPEDEPFTENEVELQEEPDVEESERIEEAAKADNIKQENKKPVNDDQVEGQLSIEDILMGMGHDDQKEPAEEDKMEEKKKNAEPILPPDIQRLIDEIEGVLPEEPQPVRRTAGRADEPRENMGAITQQLRIDDIAEFLDASDDLEEDMEGFIDDLPEEVDEFAPRTEQEAYEDDYAGEYEDSYEEEYDDAEESYQDEEEEFTAEYEEADELYDDEYDDGYDGQDEFEEEYEEDYSEDEFDDGETYEEDYEDAGTESYEEEYDQDYYDEYEEELAEYDAEEPSDDIEDIAAGLEEEFRPNPEHAEGFDDREIPDDDDGIDIMSATTPLSRKETAKMIATGKTAPLPLNEISDALSMSDTGFVVHGRYDLETQSGIGTRAGLTEEQKKLFSYFVPVRGMSEQLVDVLEQDHNCSNRNGTSKTGNLLIIGNKGNGKTVLAVDVVKAIQKQRNIRQGKVAIVTGDSLNKKKISDIFEKLYGGALIIEKAGKLNEKTVARLNKAMERDTGEMMVVLEEQRKPLDRLLSSNREFRRKFTSRLEVPIFINDELVTFGQTYAQENGYRIDEMGILALYSRIDALQREDHAVTVAEVKEVMDEAMEHSQKASAKKLVKRVFGKNTDDADRIILSEKDFNI
ncbi:CbbX protein [[Eubacterium] contortum]|uniref:CbbX protein n=1 Tax=Faecalicatena contorta TaxID=39482 RepID=A0A174BT13_9FIRM|nr:hypothetical protein [Faecalicatena contorta]CUO02778.1 CbbX protein [[Eubacterium] contortum] [Faecalicatena contorta]